MKTQKKNIIDISSFPMIVKVATHVRSVFGKRCF